MRAMCDQASQEIVASVLPMFTEAFRMMVEKVNSQITVNAPAVHVAAPVNVNVPETEMGDVNVTVPGLEALAGQIAQTNNLLGRLVYLAEQPVIKTVKRNANAQIEQVTEKR